MKISDFIENNKIICVTHGGADDLCSAALISVLTPKEVEVNIIRIGRDIIDNTGDINPYNYMTNCISRVAIDPSGDETFKAIMSTIIIQLTAMFCFEAQGAKDRKILASLPKVVIKNKVFLYKSEPGSSKFRRNIRSNHLYGRRFYTRYLYGQND